MNDNPAIITFGSLWRGTLSSLKGNWGRTILAVWLVAVISAAVGFIPRVNLLVNLLLIPLEFGLIGFLLGVIRSQDPALNVLIGPYRWFGHALWARIRPAIFIFLWSLLFIIPGMIASLRYAMTPFIVLDHPEMPVVDAMRRSCQLMRGHKWRLFGYGLLLGLLSLPLIVITLGVILIWWMPFVGVFFAKFYAALDEADPLAPQIADAPVEA